MTTARLSANDPSAITPLISEAFDVIRLKTGDETDPVLQSLIQIQLLQLNIDGTLEIAAQPCDLG